MSAKIEHIDLWPGDHVFVRVKGCAELNVLVEVSKDGKATVRGPFNCKSRTFEILTSGLREYAQHPDTPQDRSERTENMNIRITLAQVRTLMKAEQVRLVGFLSIQTAQPGTQNARLAGAHAYEIERHVRDLRKLCVGKEVNRKGLK